MHRLVLTFDDGPVPEFTPRILDALAQYKAPATFFVVGRHLEVPGAIEIIRRAVAEGHLIGNHTFDHPDLTKLSPEEIRSQIARTHDLISEFEPKRKLFRPPYGFSNPTVKAVANELGYELVFWNSSSEDWRVENASSVWVNIAIEQVSSQHAGMCLFHDRPHTAEYLPEFLERMRLLGTHEFVDYYHRRDVRAYVRGAGRRMQRWARSAVSAMFDKTSGRVISERYSPAESGENPQKSISSSDVRVRKLGPELLPEFREPPSANRHSPLIPPPRTGAQG